MGSTGLDGLSSIYQGHLLFQNGTYDPNATCCPKKGSSLYSFSTICRLVRVTWVFSARVTGCNWINLVWERSQHTKFHCCQKKKKQKRTDQEKLERELQERASKCVRGFLSQCFLPGSLKWLCQSWCILLGCWDFNFLSTNGFFRINPLEVSQLLAGLRRFRNRAMVALV